MSDAQNTYSALTSETLHRITQLVMDNPVAYRRCFADIGGSALAGLLLSQFYYWTGVVNRENKARRGWFYKSAEEIREETGLSTKEQITARKKLVAKGILEEVRKGIPAILWFRINPFNLNKAIAELLHQKDIDFETENGNSNRVLIPLHVTPDWIKNTQDFTTKKPIKTAKNDRKPAPLSSLSNRKNRLVQSEKQACPFGETITETTSENKTTTTTNNAREKNSPASSENQETGFSGKDLSTGDGKLPVDIFVQLLIAVVKTRIAQNVIPQWYQKPDATWLRAKGLKLYAKYKHPDPADVAEILLCDWLTKCEEERSGPF